MRIRRRGRAHLEDLLAKAERVVRVSPADVLVLSGIAEGTDPADFEPLLDLLAAHGVPARGLVLLQAGGEVDTLDIAELVRMDQLASRTPVGEKARAATSVRATASLPCPRCAKPVPVEVVVYATDDGQTIGTSASTDQTEMGQHGLVCPGRGDVDG